MRDIQPPARFSAGTAILVVVGVIAAEMVIEALLTRGLQFGALFGLLPASAAGPEAEPTLLIVTKLLATALVAAWALRRNGEHWRATGRPGFDPAHLVLALPPVVAGITIFLSELDNVMRAVLPAFLLEQLVARPLAGR